MDPLPEVTWYFYFFSKITAFSWLLVCWKRYFSKQFKTEIYCRKGQETVDHNNSIAYGTLWLVFPSPLCYLETLSCPLECSIWIQLIQVRITHWSSWRGWLCPWRPWCSRWIRWRMRKRRTSSRWRRRNRSSTARPPRSWPSWLATGISKLFSEITV